MNKLVNNDSLTFLLPILSNDEFTHNFFINKYFIGTFIGDVDRYNYDHEILLVYKRIKKLQFYKFEVELMKHPYFTKISYDYPESDLIVYVFKIPDNLEEDYNYLVNGYYSKVNQNLKHKITKFWDGFNHTKSKSYNIFFNPEKLKKYWKAKNINIDDLCFKGEVWVPPILELELFNNELF